MSFAKRFGASTCRPGYRRVGPEGQRIFAPGAAPARNPSRAPETQSGWPSPLDDHPRFRSRGPELMQQYRVAPGRQAATAACGHLRPTCANSSTTQAPQASTPNCPVTRPSRAVTEAAPTACRRCTGSPENAAGARGANGGTRPPCAWVCHRVRRTAGVVGGLRDAERMRRAAAGRGGLPHTSLSRGHPAFTGKPRLRRRMRTKCPAWPPWPARPRSGPGHGNGARPSRRAPRSVPSQAPVVEGGRVRPRRR